MKSRMVVLIVVIMALVSLAVIRVGVVDGWEFVVDVEARSSSTVVATRQASASICNPDGEGACRIAWDWTGVDLPANAEEWVKPYFIYSGTIIPVVYIPYWCDVQLEMCQAEMTDAGMVIEPSAECLAELAEICGLAPDEQGFWYAGTLPKSGYYAFYESLLAEWYNNCPLPPATSTPAPLAPTYTPCATYTPQPSPTCRPTWTPQPSPTSYPTSTPWPTATAYPTQPPF